MQAIVVFTTSDKAKEMPLGERQQILVDIRKIYAPDISNEEWTELANGVNDFKFVITDSVKYGQVPVIDKALPPKQEEPDLQDQDEDGVTEEPDYSEPEKVEKPEEPKPEKYGRFFKPKDKKQNKINTSTLRGLLKPKKKDDEQIQ